MDSVGQALIPNLRIFEDKSRIALIRIIDLNLRLMDRWRRTQISLVGEPLDYESTMILMAIVAISAGALAQTGDLNGFEDLGTPVDSGRLRKCNISSVAATTGLNRELVRRRLESLIKNGMVCRYSDGGVRIASSVVEHPAVWESTKDQLLSIAGTVETLRREGLLFARS